LYPYQEPELRRKKMSTKLEIMHLPSNTRIKRFHTPNVGHGSDELGYGRKITTGLKAFHAGKWYRVYASCFGNAATHWIKSNGEVLHLTGRWASDIEPQD